MYMCACRGFFPWSACIGTLGLALRDAPCTIYAVSVATLSLRTAF